MRNAACVMFLHLIVFAVSFITFITAGSDNLKNAPFIQSTNETREPDKSNITNDRVQEENRQEFKVSEADITRTKYNMQKKQSRLVAYTMVTLAVIMVVITVSIGLWKDPLCCIFFILCPCCLLGYPCLLYLVKKYKEPKNVLEKNLQKYIPGVFYDDDGLLKSYRASEKEIDCFNDVIEKMERK